MIQRNMTDIIEAYLKSFLKDKEQVEIKRSDVAERFDCVPSQINYVIKTRFTQEHGYFVESKRGGGGYIRIWKVTLNDHADHYDQLIELVGERISQRNAVNLIETLVEKQLLTAREGVLLVAVMEKSLLHQISEEEQVARAHLMKTLLQQLKYQN